MNSPIRTANQNPEETVRNWLGGGGQSDTHSNDGFAQLVGSLLQSLREHKWLLVLFMFLGAIGGILKAVSETPVYQASLTMAVEPSVHRPSSQSIFDPYAFRFYETQYELLKSRSVAERVVDDLNLIERESVQKLLVRPSFFRSLMTEFSSLTGLEFVNKESVIEQPARPLNEDEVRRKRAWLTGVIQRGVSVSGGEKTNLVRVTFNSINPVFAADIANALVTAYIDQGLDSQLNRSQQTSLWLSQRIDDLKVSLDQAQINLQTFLIEEDMLDSSRSNQITTAELQTLNQEYLTARANFDELAKRYGARHPKITESRAELNAAKARLDRRSRSISSTREKEVELARLERDVKVNQELYEAFLAKFKEADLSSSGSKVASARIVDKALAPSNPIYPQKQRIILVWAFGGLLLAVGLVLLREQLDSTFKTARVIEDKLGLPLYGVVQMMKGQDMIVERLYIENKRSTFSEAFNHIRTGVMYSNVDDSPQVMVITSSVQGEGKTTVSSNLALSYAQLGRTLLIDADLRRPRLKHIVDVQANTGLVECVAGVAELGDAIRPDSDEANLFILNSGATPPNPLELLSSDRFAQLLSELRSRFDYIVIDTAPVLPASDAVVLGRLSDVLLMVIQSDRTTHHMVRDGVKRLNASNVDVDGLILTQADVKKENPYRYGGYYGYGAYAYTQDSQS